jgi:hypothetical protein
MNASQAQLPNACRFLNIPLELRDIIYGMLLTTPYCTIFDSTWSSLEFHLHTAILLVNKQVSAEAMRVLYQRNHFIILKTTGVGLALHSVPQFKLLPESKVTNPVLLIKVAVTDSRRMELVDPRTVLTTSDGLQSIIDAIWQFEDDERPSYRESIYTSDMSLTLDYNPKAVSRYHLMSNLILRPWNQIHDLKELVLIGDIEEATREHLEKSILEGPFPSEVAIKLAEYHSHAEREFERTEYNAARWWCKSMEEYWDYLFNLVPCWEGDELWEVLEKSLPILYELRLKLVKSYLGQLEYKNARHNADEARSRMIVEECPIPTLLMQTKFHLSAALAHSALGKTKRGTDDLDKATEILYEWSYVSEAEITKELLFQDLKVAVNNELIRLKSAWRCGRRGPVSPTIQNGPEWELGECQHSFWEWLELPEEWRLAWK